MLAATSDFSVTQFVGLMTEEDTLGVSSAPTTGGDVELGGAFISFSTTMAVPDSVVAAALAKLKAQDHPPAPPRILSLFTRGPADLAPLLGIVPIVDNKVTIEVPQLSTNSKSPLFISAQGAGQGSIEAAGISSFLVTCNEFAAGAIVGSLRAGQSPFTVHYNLTLMFYINACHIDVHIDVDKVFDQFSGAVAVKAGFFQADLSAKYLDCETSGGISTTITMNGAAMDPDIKTMVDKQSQDMQDKAWDMVKNEIFNWQPTSDTPASASTGACGGAGVTLKSNYQKHGIKFDNTLDLNTVISKLDTVSGTLSELQSSIKTNLSKYLAIVDVGSAFQKIQVAATAYIDFSTADTADPISAAMIEVSYPDLDTSGNIQLAANGTPNLKTLGEGFHYTPTAVNLAAPSTLARWTRDNPNDIINIPFLRLRQDAPQWKADQIKVVKTLIYHSDDARVDLSTGGTQYQVTTIGTDNKPRVSPDEVGYIYVNFVLDRRLVSNETVTLTITIGTRTDTLTIQAQGMTHPSAVWQVWSDKYFSQAVAKVKIRRGGGPADNRLLRRPRRLERSASGPGRDRPYQANRALRVAVASTHRPGAGCAGSAICSADAEGRSGRPPMSSPLLAGRVGNLFVDSVDAASRWYLPTLTLAGDPDGAFAFAVGQENQQADGRPFNTARLTFGATLAVPSDVATFARANPGVRLQPIALTSFVATLNSFYTDTGGAQQQRSFRADAQGDLTAGSVVLSFATGVFGDAVAALYQDLRLFGKTTLVLSAVFAVFSAALDARPPARSARPRPASWTASWTASGAERDADSIAGSGAAAARSLGFHAHTAGLDAKPRPRRQIPARRLPVPLHHYAAMPAPAASLRV